MHTVTSLSCHAPLSGAPHILCAHPMCHETPSNTLLPPLQMPPLALAYARPSCTSRASIAHGKGDTCTGETTNDPTGREPPPYKHVLPRTLTPSHKMRVTGGERSGGSLREVLVSRRRMRALWALQRVRARERGGAGRGSAQRLTTPRRRRARRRRRAPPRSPSAR